MPKKKYSTELKLEIVDRYLNEFISINKLGEEYNVWPGDIQKWRDAYLEHGVEGLCTTHWKYSGDFKVFVVEYMHNTGSSLRQTAAHFNIPSYRSIIMWEKKYNEQGKEALYKETRGRPRKMGDKKVNTRKKKTETNEDLLAEVKRLRMENEYLKKLNALIQEREKSKKPTK